MAPGIAMTGCMHCDAVNEAMDHLHVTGHPEVTWKGWPVHPVWACTTCEDSGEWVSP